MMAQLYTLSFIASAAMLTFLIVRYKTRISVYYLLMFMTITISNFGYMQMASARNLESAVYANQIIYLGACFTPFFMLMSIADLCKIHVKAVYQALILIYSAFVFSMVSTIGVVDWFYTGVSFEIVDGTGVFSKVYGPLHILYPMYVIGAGIVATAFIITAFTKRKEVSYVTSTLILICMGSIDIVYIVQKIFHFNYDFIPFSYLISLGGILFLLRRISMYEVTVISTNSMVESLAYGFVICDSNERYLGSDEAAKLWFPELKELAIDRVIPKADTPFLEQIKKWVSGEDDREAVLLEHDENIYEAKHSIIKECKNHNVHCIYLRDDTKQQQYTKLVQQYSEDLERDVENKTKNLRKIQNDILKSMANIVENRDNNTGGHIARTSDIVMIFVDYLQANSSFAELTPHMANSIVKAAPLHDFGKIAIPDIVLNKPGKFTDEEYEIMKQHSAKGAVIVEQILHHVDDAKFRQIAVNVAHFHHEKWDGRGYPEGISGTDIPFEARVMALADVFDALVSKRVYKDSFGYDKAFSIIEESCGTHFDPQLCKAFLECRPQLEALYDSYTD